MSMFDGLLQPGEASRIALRRELEARRERWDRSGYFYRGAGDLILKHGTFFTGRELPDRWVDRIGPEGNCFENAWMAALAEPDLRYFEGVYAAHGAFTPHAWCVDPDGGVVELTWVTRVDRGRDVYVDGLMQMGIVDPARIAYAGVELHPELIRWFGETYGEYCLLDRPSHDADIALRPHSTDLDFTQDHDFPILKVPYDKDRRTLPSGQATP